MMIILSALIAFTTPLWLDVFLSSTDDSANIDGFATPTINPLQILIGLIILYLIPMLIGTLIVVLARIGYISNYLHGLHFSV